MWFFSKPSLTKAQKRWWYRAEKCDERNLYWAEMDREQREWREKVERAVRNGWPLPVGGGLIKARFEISSGLMGKESGWDIDTIPVADFGNVNLAAPGTIRTGFSTFPLVNPAQVVVQSPDPLPFQLSTLAATNASRVAGSSTNPLALLVGCYLVHITSAGAVYQPTATTTMNIRTISAVTTTGAGFTTLATIVATTAANFVDSLTIAAPTERQVATPTGTLLTTSSGIFNGDSLFAELAFTVGASLNVQGNLLYLELEVI